MRLSVQSRRLAVAAAAAIRASAIPTLDERAYRARYAPACRPIRPSITTSPRASKKARVGSSSPGRTPAYTSAQEMGVQKLGVPDCSSVSAASSARACPRRISMMMSESRRTPVQRGEALSDVSGPVHQVQGLAHQVGHRPAPALGGGLEPGVSSRVEIELSPVHVMYIHRSGRHGNGRARHTISARMGCSVRRKGSNTRPRISRVTTPRSGSGSPGWPKTTGV